MEHPAIPTQPVLTLTELCFAYPQQTLIAGLSARIPAGVTLVRGGVGRGKTTLLRLIAGELPARSGRLQLGDVRLDLQPQGYRQQLFWVDPRSDALDALKITDYFADVQRRYRACNQRLLDDLTDGLGLAPHLDKHLYMLSTGSKRKVWLAAAFASGAALTLLDEPFAALDKPSIVLVLTLLAEAAGQQQRAWVLADHVAPKDVALATVIDLGD